MGARAKSLATILPEDALQDARACWDDARTQLLSMAWEQPAETEPERVAVARVICAEVFKAYWDVVTGKDRRWWQPWRGDGFSLLYRGRRAARQAASALSEFPEPEASYLVGTLYTALLPPRLRATRGAYYTPPVLVERLLDLAAAEGIDFSTATMLDPACGGGAFLAPLAHRVLTDHRVRRLSPESQLEHLERRLAGFEIDSFAAWLSRGSLQLLVHHLSCAASRPIKVDVAEGDALEIAVRDERQFDLIVGNPPYGRIGLSDEQRQVFGRSLFGHANLYGVFLDAALRWRRSSGLVAFLTPTSFLGGQYFSKLRDLLLEEAPPLVVDFVEARRGVFDSVLQETCLAVFGPNPACTTVVHVLKVNNGSVGTVRAGTFPLNAHRAGAPWLLPRTPEQTVLTQRANNLPTRLHHMGYKASTGPLVWNRHKHQLRQRRSAATLPLIWAEAVRPNRFSFDYRQRASSPFILVEDGQDHLVTTKPCVLVQRTTAKEQDRRLIACAVPDEFLDEWGGLVVENHVNILRTTDPTAVSPEAVAAVLNTKIVDQLFRCLSGSVAVSATELHALPLPDRAILRRVERLCRKISDPEERAARIEAVVAEVYRDPT